MKNYQEFLIDVVNEGLADESDLTGLFNGFLPVNEVSQGNLPIIEVSQLVQLLLASERGKSGSFTNN